VINGSVGPLPDGATGIDQPFPVTAASAAQYIKQGYTFVIRYVGRGDGSKHFVDLTEAEGQTIIDAGLALCVVQHPLAEGWSPTAARGQKFGAAAGSLAAAAGLPPGVSVWVDLEGVAPTAQPQDVIDYCSNWHDEVSAAGFVSGIYIGANPGLTADQLYWDLPMKSYWRGGSSAASGVPADIPHRGYQLMQRIRSGSKFDTNVNHADNFQGTVIWCKPLLS